MAEFNPLDLIDRLRRRDPSALREAYELYKNDVLAVAATVMGPAAGDGSAIWDVLHDVFVALARTCATLRADSNLRAYLARAAANRAKDWLRQNRRTRTSSEVVEQIAIDASTMFQAIDDEDEAVHLWRAVAALPEEQRLIVGLRVWGDLTFREIAAAEGISENTAQSRWRYAIDKLRRLFLKVEP